MFATIICGFVIGVIAAACSGWLNVADSAARFWCFAGSIACGYIVTLFTLVCLVLWRINR